MKFNFYIVPLGEILTKLYDCIIQMKNCKNMPVSGV